MLIRGDARALPVRDGCVQCVVTSPPYWRLRDYGDPAQLGLEPTPDAYVASLVAVFREVWRVLAPDGTVWLNLGDSYATGAGSVGECPGGGQQGESWRLRGLSMPESITDRPTKAHEYLFLLAKSERYYYDAQAIAEASVDPESVRGRNKRNDDAFCQSDPNGKARTRVGFGKIPAGTVYLTKNRRSVWHIATMPYAGAHFATMPEALVTLCILAGCPLGGRVLDPFIGSGTTGAVAERLGRRWVGVDLTYQHLARERTAQRGLIWA